MYIERINNPADLKTAYWTVVSGRRLPATMELRI